MVNPGNERREVFREISRTATLVSSHSRSIADGNSRENVGQRPDSREMQFNGYDNGRDVRYISPLDVGAFQLYVLLSLRSAVTPFSPDQRPNWKFMAFFRYALLKHRRPH